MVLSRLVAYNFLGFCSECMAGPNSRTIDIMFEAPLVVVRVLINSPA